MCGGFCAVAQALAVPVGGLGSAFVNADIYIQLPGFVADAKNSNH